MADVFLSYKRADAARAAQIAKAIEEHGYSVFFDAEIAVGESWTGRIEQELNAAKCVVVMWSKHSTPTDVGKWVHNEARVAMGRTILAPALMDDCTPPVEFSGEQAAKLASWRGDPSETEWKKLIARIAHCVQQPPKPVAAKPWLRRSVLLGGSIVAMSGVAAAAGAFIVPRLTERNADPLERWVKGLTGPALDVVRNAFAASAEASTNASQASTIWDSAQENMLLAQASPADAQYEVGAAEDGVGVYKGQARRHGARAIGVFTKSGDYTYGGEWEGSLFRGLGRKEITTPHGIEKQSGKFVATVLNGKGVIEYADGAVYRGDLVAGVPHGVGVKDSAPGEDGAQHRFAGAFAAGKLEGYAVEYDARDAKLYNGLWRNGLRADATAPQVDDALAEILARARSSEASAREIADQGRNFADLAGEYADRARRAFQSGADPRATGLDYVTQPAWGEYAGQLRNTENALGHFRSAAEPITYSGGWSPLEQENPQQTWAVPTYDGYGVYTFLDAHQSLMRTQTGLFDNCCQTQQGEIEFKDGRIYRGVIAVDVATGLGVTTFPNGNQHVGEHVDGKLNGLGVEFDASGAIVRQGHWTAGELDPA